MTSENEAKALRRAAFNLYLRTGQRVDLDGLEKKFNPWHDPKTGQFTFAGRGRYFPRGSRSSPPGASSGDVRSRAAAQSRLEPTNSEPLNEFDPKNPRNHSIYTVRKGESLTSLAATRNGLAVSDLAWLNDMPADQKLQIGQRIRIPHQQYLDAGKRARDKFLALSYYLETQEGRLPSDVANPPPLDEQLLNSNWQKVTKNGYEFPIDAIGRSRRVTGELSLATTSPRSRRNQMQAGGKDRRRPGDDGGHYIAARFNGPSDAFNHFAQDASFNRGEYRALEDIWAKHLRAGHRIVVDIVPHYEGLSVRPYKLVVAWYVDGRERKREFRNEKRGQ